MTRYVLSAAGVALALGAPGAVYAQAAQPMPSVYPVNQVTTYASTATVTTPRMPRAGGDRDFAASSDNAIEQPDLAPIGMAPATPGAVWIPGHYDWDAARQIYVWRDAQLTLPPRPNALWIAGHWQETPSSWIWIDGRWN